MADLTSHIIAFSEDKMFSPESGVPLPQNEDYLDVRARAAAACRSMVALKNFHAIDFGRLTLSEEEKEDVEHIVDSIVEAETSGKDPSKAVTEKEFSRLSNASVVMVNNILQEYSASVVEDAQKMRNLITNKLLLETEHEDARIRLKALELLGKISDVSLFSEKTEVTVTHQDTGALKAKLVERLERLANIKHSEATDAELIEHRENT